jgi:TetR/AcrR family transcriptional regulator, transcriptional repressor for nem operon
VRDAGGLQTARKRQMARPREFDETAALEAAIACFWNRGYEATSVRDLAENMGLSAPSLYNAYGDKHALFVQALEHYLDRSMRERIERLEKSRPPKDAIREFVGEIIDHSLSDRERRGCFLVNSALEVAPHDKKLGRLIAERFAELEAFFARSIRKAQTQGTVSRKLVVKDVARLLLGIVIGIRVLARVQPEPAMLDSLARPVLALLD